MTLSIDEKFMRLALDAASGVLGKTTPNPAVGCVLVKNNLVIGTGATGRAGDNHSEINALAQAAEHAEGATAYVTLEPCSHYGRTPPCVNALVKAEVKRVVVACIDPDPRVSGRGIEILKSAGIQVEVGCLAGEAVHLNRGFLSRVVRKRPWLTLKLAMSLDGRIACHNGHSQWITNAQARQAGHQIRAINDAILVGCGTVIADDPRLTVRLLEHGERAIKRVIIEGKRPCPSQARVLTDEYRHATIVMSTDGKEAGRINASQDYTRLVCQPSKLGEKQIDLLDAMHKLVAQDINSILVEGGSYTASALLKAGLVDEVQLFRAPCIIGGDGLTAIGDLGLERVDESIKLQLLEIKQHGDNWQEFYLTQLSSAFMEGLYNKN